jgi:hypothetical protein
MTDHFLYVWEQLFIVEGSTAAHASIQLTADTLTRQSDIGHAAGGGCRPSDDM